MTSATNCGFLLLFYESPFLTFGSPSSQNRSKGGQQSASFTRLGVRNNVQYYTYAATVVFFYDYLLTLGDEVSHITSIEPR